MPNSIGFCVRHNWTASDWICKMKLIFESWSRVKFSGQMPYIFRCYVVSKSMSHIDGFHGSLMLCNDPCIVMYITTLHICALPLFSEVSKPERFSGDNIIYKPMGENAPDMVYMGSLTNFDLSYAWSQDKCVPLVREITFENGEVSFRCLFLSAYNCPMHLFRFVCILICAQPNARFVICIRKVPSPSVYFSHTRAHPSVCVSSVFVF